MDINEIAKIMTRKEFLNCINDNNGYFLVLPKIFNIDPVDCPNAFNLNTLNDSNECIGISHFCKECWKEAIKDIKFKDDLEKENNILKFECIKDFYMENRDKAFTKGCIYNGEKYNDGSMKIFDDDLQSSIHEISKNMANLYFKLKNNIQLIKNKSERVITKVDNSKLQEKTYKGWEIIKMINEGILKKGDKYIRLLQESSNKSLIKDATFIVGDKTYIPNVISFFTDNFMIQKEYMLFNEARKFGTPKHKNKDIGYNYGYFSANDFIKEMDKKVWEVEE